MSTTKIPSFTSTPVLKKSFSTKMPRTPSSDSTTRFKVTKPAFVLNNNNKVVKTSGNQFARKVFLRSYTNQILEENEMSGALHIPLEKMHSTERMRCETAGADKLRNKRKNLEVLIPESSLSSTNPHTCTSIGGDRPRLMLKKFDGPLSATDLIKSRSPTNSCSGLSGQRFLAFKGNTARRVDTENTNRTNETSQEKTWRLVTQRSMQSLQTYSKDYKVNKILKEVQERIDMNNKLGYTHAEEDSKVFAIKTEPSVLPKYTQRQGSKIMIIENDQKKMRISEISNKLRDYREALSTQLEELNRAKTPVHPKTKSMSEKNLKGSRGITNFNKRSFEPEIATRKKVLKAKFRDTIRRVLKKMYILNLTMEEIVSKKAFSSVPYEKQGSKIFIDHVKNGNLEEAEKLLETNRYYVYDYDSQKQTPLHWAAKRGFTLVVKLLLSKGADPDACDLSGRTPLFLAAKGGFLPCVKLLLFFGANPMIKSGAGKLALDYASELDVRSVLERGYKIHMRLSVCSFRKFKQNWEALDKKDFELKRHELIVD